MRITFHPLCGSAAAAAIRKSKVFDPTVRLHFRFVELADAAFMGVINPGPSLATRRLWIKHYRLLEAQGREFYFVVVENGLDRGLVRMNDFAEIGGEASFGWGDFVSLKPGLLTATALSIYSLGFDTLGFARAHIAVPATNPDLSAFHLNTGAELEYDDGDHRYFRFGAETFEHVRRDALQRRVEPVAARA